MNLFAQLGSWLKAVLTRRRLENRMEAEVRFHIGSYMDELLQRGVHPQEARRMAQIAFGGIESHKDAMRASLGLRLWDELWADLRFGLRMLRKSPGFTIVAALTLALGIGANTAIFSVVEGVLLRPLPYKDSNSLAVLWTDDAQPNLHEVGTGYPIFEEWRKQGTLFSDMAICSRQHAVLLDLDDQTERIAGATVSGNFFRLLGVAPLLGRAISQDDEEHSRPVAVLSYSLWLRGFAASPGVVGRTFEINGRATTIVGVMPAQFRFPSRETEIWEPVTSLRDWEHSRTFPFSHFWIVVGSLRPGASFTGAQAQMSAIGTRLSRQYPDVDLSKNSIVSFAVRVVPLKAHLTPSQIRLALLVLLAAVGFLLLIAVANIVNLLLARGASRESEFAVRVALGAGTSRLLRQLVTESLLLSCVSALLGLALASGMIRAISRLGPSYIPRFEEIRIDSTVLVFTAGIALLTGLIFGVAPAWFVSTRHLDRSLGNAGRNSSSGRRLSRLRDCLVIAEFAVAVLMLAGAGLLVRSFMRIQQVDLGLRPERVLMMRIEFPRSGSDARALAFYQQALERVEALPGVQAAGVINSFLIENNPDVVITVEGHSFPAREPIDDQVVSSGYFGSMGVPLLAGRYLSKADARDSLAVAVVNQTMARHFWPGESPVGKRFKYGDRQSTEAWITVVGVVGDIHREGLEKDVIAQLFLPHTQSPGPGMLRDMNLMVHTAGEPWQLAAAVRREIHGLDKTVSVFDVTTLDEQLDHGIAMRRFQMLLLCAFSGVALLLAAVGIFGLLHYSVSQRTREIAIRMALGAGGGDVLGLILGTGAKTTMAGVAIGLGVTFALTRLMKSLLFHVAPTDPVTLGGVVMLLLAVALLACYVPARRAVRVDPMLALRHE